MRSLASRLGRAAVVFAIAAAAMSTPAAAEEGFGVGSFTTTASSPQAGAHADVSSSFSLSTEALGNPIGHLKDVHVVLPAGLVGNSQSIERCSYRAFVTAKCSTASQVGLFKLAFVSCPGTVRHLTAPAEAGATEITVDSTEHLCTEEQAGGNVLTIGSGSSTETAHIAYLETATTITLSAPLEHSYAAGEPITHIAHSVEGPLPLYNLAPEPGHVATFGVFILAVTILVQVDMSPDGRLVATIEDSTTLLPPSGGGLTLWGVPADPSHDSLRCTEFFSCGPTSAPPAPFITTPTDCGGPPPEGEVTIESWKGETATRSTTEPPPTGCGLLSIEPSVQVLPDSTQADSPAGYSIDVTVPQRSEAYGLATPAIDDLSLVLPAGTSFSPAFGNGLEACSRAQFAEGSCPDASKMGTAEIETPLLPQPLTGSIYFGQPTASEKYPIFVRVTGDNASLGLVGRAEPNERTGQVTTVFEHAPQLPFKHLRLSLFGGPSGALDNPMSCGPATSVATISAYGTPQVTRSSSFTVQGACPESATFAPGFVAGATSPLAAAFSPFTLTISRGDGEQDLGAFAAQLPQGVIGLIGSVPPCPEQQVAHGECPQSSQVGTAVVGAGAGAAPLYLSGPVYLTGPYEGAPFGLAVAIHAGAGPIDLGEIVVRARVDVDPDGLALKIASDPLPQIVGGVPLRMRTLSVTLDRPEFMLNPTGCAAQQVAGTITSTAGIAAAVSTPFRVAGCAALPFKPRLSASTSAHASLVGDGAGLEVDIAAGGVRNATMKSISLTLPGVLRPRLTTIQHACLIATADIEGCPSEAVVGSVTATTPTLGQPLSGNVVLVTHGGVSKPALVMILRGGGVSAKLEGTVSISRTHVVTAAFDDLPDIPVNDLKLSFPRGPHSLLGAITSVCAKALKVSYRLGDRSGDPLSGSARMKVSGCPRKSSKDSRASRASHRRAKRSQAARRRDRGASSRGASR